jgi:hypothetical protein
VALREVSGPQGSFVIRSEPHGVPTVRWLWRPPWKLGLGSLHVLRWARRDKSWTVRVILRANDPFGPDTHAETVPSKRQVVAVLDRLETDVRRGSLKLDNDP